MYTVNCPGTVAFNCFLRELEARSQDVSVGTQGYSREILRSKLMVKSINVDSEKRKAQQMVKSIKAENFYVDR